ncbi:MAG TPA: hypothetical protein VHZ50_16460 [Puia sp.]|jgi:hypothetical protein|nr:hypothetical protein [Puia sp.]
MGIYYQAMDHLRKELIEPPLDFSIKFPGICHPNNPFPNMVILANALGANFQIVNDCVEDVYYSAGYKNMTDHYFKMLCKYWPEYDFERAEWNGLNA